ncbi:MAG: carbon-nitrogen hydrolase family protein [Fimbriimonadaceae bacterium]
MRIACVQCGVVYGDPDANALYVESKHREMARNGAEMVVFPEACLTGYCVDSAEEARRIAIVGPPFGVFERLQRAVDETRALMVVGFAESAEGRVSNSAALLEPDTPPRVYRKTHLPDLGLDKHVEPGDALPVFETRLGRVGILVCFDLRLPEPTRVLALEGADLVLLPTNWPEGAQVAAEHIAVARAAENRVFVATCNRVGTENGFTFIGGSKIVGPTGAVLAAAGADEETIVADIDLAEARNKRSVVVPGLYETDVVASRRPELYDRLIEA